jgi:O-antigen ligase
MRWPLAVLAALALVGGAVALDPGERFEEFKQPPPSFAARGFDPVGAEGSGRWQLWGESIEAFESAPVVGLGSGGYEEWWAQHATIDLFVRDAHSLFLQQLAELGLAGILLVAAFGAAIALAARRRLALGRDGDAGVLIAVVAAGAVAAGIDWSWIYPAVLGPVVVAAGLLAASAPDRGPPGDRFALGLGAVTIAWVAIVAAALVVLTELKLEQSRSAAAGGRIAEGLDRAREARTVQPWSPQPYVQIALLEELGGDFEAALDRLDEAERHDSEDWRLALIEARLHGRTGDRTARRTALRRARTLSPRFSGAGEGRETR